MTIPVPIWFYIVICMGYCGGWIVSYTFFRRRNTKWYINIIDMILTLLTLPLILPLLIFTLFIPKKLTDKWLGYGDDKL